MPATLTIPIHAIDDSVVLLASGALFWPRGSTLFLADLHLGKEGAFQHAGIAIPAAIGAADLTRLAGDIQRWAPDRLVILGDFLHSAHSQHPATLDQLHAWRTQLLDLSITVVRGNHDRHAGALPSSLNIPVVDEPYPLATFICRHEPLDPAVLTVARQNGTHSPQYSLAGHIHPRALLRESGRHGIQLPCFHVGPDQTVLPAYGAFTGGHVVRPRVGDRIFVLAGGEVHAVKTQR